MLVIDPAGNGSGRLPAGEHCSPLRFALSLMPARQRQTAHQRNAQRQSQRDLEGLAAFAGEKLLLALQKVVGRVVDARAWHPKRKDARQQKIVTGALWRMAKNRAQPVSGSVATSVAIAGLNANSSTPKM